MVPGTRLFRLLPTPMSLEVIPEDESGQRQHQKKTECDRIELPILRVQLTIELLLNSERQHSNDKV